MIGSVLFRSATHGMWDTRASYRHVNSMFKLIIGVWSQIYETSICN